jgi:hypothetical protein
MAGVKRTLKKGKSAKEAYSPPETGGVAAPSRDIAEGIL